MWKVALEVLLGLLALGTAPAIYFLFQEEEGPSEITLGDEYDYIVVGSGSAGAIVASRLSEDPEIKVALIESGPDIREYPDASIPSNALATSVNMDINWKNPTRHTRQKEDGTIKKRDMQWSGGKVLGGSSSINFMMAVRGSPHDYDYWASLGNEGWAYKDVLPYFKKLETVTDPEWIQSGYRGTDGPISITEQESAISDSLLNGAESVGYPINNNYNGKDIIGISKLQSNVGKGKRSTTAVAYLEPARTRPNLHILVMAHVTKVVFKGKKAVGVEYLHDARMKNVRARREVVLSAGTTGSAKLLMLSGVGPRDNLERLKIPVVADLPVGKNVMDHICSDVISFRLNDGVIKPPSDLDRLRYMVSNTGPLAMSGAAAHLFFRAENQPKEHKFPYAQLVFLTSPFNPHPIVGEGLRTLFHLSKEYLDELHGNERGMTGMFLMPALLHSNSRMTISLNSSNPFVDAEIKTTYFSDPMDVEITIEMVKAAIAIMDSPQMKALGAQNLNVTNPNCSSIEYGTNEFWRCQITESFLTYFHSVGSCMMGKKDNPLAVVDTRLRVHGLTALRVVDASVMPEVPSGNTNFPTMMIGEKGAAMIREDN